MFLTRYEFRYKNPVLAQRSEIPNNASHCFFQMSITKININIREGNIVNKAVVNIFLKMNTISLNLSVSIRFQFEIREEPNLI